MVLMQVVESQDSFLPNSFLIERAGNFILIMWEESRLCLWGDVILKSHHFNFFCIQREFSMCMERKMEDVSNKLGKEENRKALFVWPQRIEFLLDVALDSWPPPRCMNTSEK